VVFFLPSDWVYIKQRAAPENVFESERVSLGGRASLAACCASGMEH